MINPFNSWQVEVPHLCLNVIFEDVDDLAKVLQECMWADGQWHRCLFLAAGYLADQPEHDTLCCEGSQTCKQCKCPKNRLHEARSNFEPRKGREVETAVKRAALQGRLPGDRGPALSAAVVCTKTGSDQRQASLVSYSSVHTNGLRSLSQAPWRGASHRKCSVATAVV